MPRLMMSTPRAMAFFFISSIAANRYGGKVLIRLDGTMGNPAMRSCSFRTRTPSPLACYRLLQRQDKRKGVLTRLDLRASVGHARPRGPLAAVRLAAQRVRRPGCAGQSDRELDRSRPANLHLRIPGHPSRRARRPAPRRDAGPARSDTGGLLD